MSEETKIEAAICHEAVGLYISVDGNTERIIESLMRGDAEKKIEVLVKFRGEKREFTFVDFFTRLGFYEKIGGKK